MSFENPGIPNEERLPEDLVLEENEVAPVVAEKSGDSKLTKWVKRNAAIAGVVGMGILGGMQGEAQGAEKDEAPKTTPKIEAVEMSEAKHREAIANCFASLKKADEIVRSVCAGTFNKGNKMSRFGPVPQFGEGGGDLEAVKAVSSLFKAFSVEAKYIDMERLTKEEVSTFLKNIKLARNLLDDYVSEVTGDSFLKTQPETKEFQKISVALEKLERKYDKK